MNNEDNEKPTIEMIAKTEITTQIACANLFLFL